MKSSEVVQFSEVFYDLARVLVLRKMDDAERGQVLSAYFKALGGFDLSVVKAGADALAIRAKHFPTPAEWIDAMPRRLTHPADVPVMSEQQAQTWRAAETVYWERDPCACEACVAAGVDWKPGRFVPEVNGYDSERKVFDQGRAHIVTAGHWAHGAELAGYYEARGAYLSAADAMRGGARKAALSLVTRQA
ncbi:hypothetical protein UFOVP1236_15 [uncultured Caudovirales phage]|uniref:Uncharacterized protein n=1 Tax=uncultured Caudovirales phage TaxID=2100421 RepID=A0A6J5RCT2_9CAUD|nr:hypothetical protein UFOVP1236_15 [uncultured Caudovirales phage]